MPAVPLPIARVSINPNSGAARQNDGVHSRSQRTGPGVAGTVFAGVLAKRSGTAGEPAPTPAVAAATHSDAHVGSNAEQPTKAKAKADSRDSKIAAQGVNVLLVAPQLPVPSSRPNGTVGQANSQQIPHHGRILPNPSGRLLPGGLGDDTKPIAKHITSHPGSSIVLLDHGDDTKTPVSTLDPQATGAGKRLVLSKEHSVGLLKPLFTHGLASFVGSQQDKAPGQAKADVKQWLLPGLASSPVGLPAATTASPRSADPATNGFSNVLANLYAGSTGWNAALGSEVAWMAQGDVHQIRLRLYPRRLGNLDVQIQLQQQQVNIAFVVQHPAAAGAVQDALAQLGGMLAQQGLSLGDAQVSYGQSQASSAWSAESKGRDPDSDKSEAITLFGLSRQGRGLFDDFA